MALLPWFALAVAIVLETIGTSCLQASHQFTRLGPTIATAVCYALSFWLVTIALKTIPVAISYAIWSGVGIVLIGLIGRFWFGQVLDGPAYVGMGLIVAGVIVINLFSSASVH